MFSQRIFTATVLLCVFVSGLVLLPRAAWGVFLLPALIIASVEWARLAGYRNVNAMIFCAVTLLTAVALLDATGMGWDLRLHSLGIGTTPLYACAAVFWIAIVPVWLGKGWRPQHPLVLGAAGWIVLVPTWAALVELQTSPLQLLFILGVIWVADTAAYVAGRRFGRRRLAPNISPGKTWEGIFGAGVAVAVYYALAHAARIPRDSVLGLLEGSVVVAAVAVMSVEGDLFESWMKRRAGVKDSGNLLPGHGGLLDRIDGITAGLPVAALLLQALSGKAAG